ncbi:MAG: hypothetical protein ACK2TU_01170, partial [Anaerolineales bacterium]
RLACGGRDLWVCAEEEGFEPTSDAHCISICYILQEILLHRIGHIHIERTCDDSKANLCKLM